MRLRTTRELRQQEHIPVPVNPDSLYKPIERQERVMPAIHIPAKLQKALPFADQLKTMEMVEKKREKREKKKRPRPDEIPEKLVVDHRERKK